jgi:hypothetical protein
MKVAWCILWFVIPSCGLAQTVTGNCNATARGINIRIEVKCGGEGLSRADAQKLADQYRDLADKINKGNVTASIFLSKLDALKKELETQKAIVETQNCPGGICIQGSSNAPNTVNNYAKVPAPPRHLSANQMTELEAFASSLANINTVYFLSSSSSESQTFAREIFAIFKQRGLSEGHFNYPIMQGDIVEKNVCICINSGDLSNLEIFPQAQKLANILGESGRFVSFTSYTNMQAGRITVWVTPQPDVMPPQEAK